MSDFQKRLDLANTEVEKRKIEYAKAEQDIDNLEKQLESQQAELKELGIEESNLETYLSKNKEELDETFTKIEESLK